MRSVELEGSLYYCMDMIHDSVEAGAREELLAVGLARRSQQERHALVDLHLAAADAGEEDAEHTDGRPTARGQPEQLPQLIYAPSPSEWPRPLHSPHRASCRTHSR